MPEKTICLLPGDGIGPKIVAEAIESASREENSVIRSCTMTDPAPERRHRRRGRASCPTLPWRPARPADAAVNSSARWALKGVGHHRSAIRPERDPARYPQSPPDCSPSRPCSPANTPRRVPASHFRQRAADLIVVRELTGSIFFSQPASTAVHDSLRTGFNTAVTTEIARISQVAFSSPGA